MKSFTLATALVCGMTFFKSTNARPSYLPTIPNGAVFQKNLGHVDGVTANRNQFAKDYVAEGRSWTPTLCAKDSDGDGHTNGEELGDPNCVWTQGDTPEFTVGLSNPGITADVPTPPPSKSPSVSPSKSPTQAPTQSPTVQISETTVLNGLGTVTYKVLNDDQVRIKFEVQADDGWLAVGVASSGTSMIGSKVVVGQRSGVEEFALDSKTGSEILNNGGLGPSDDLVNPTFSNEGSTLTLEFIASSIGGVPLPIDGSDVGLVFAYGTTDNFGQHANDARGGLTVNFEKPTLQRFPVLLDAGTNEFRGELGIEILNEEEIRVVFDVNVAAGWLAVGIPTSGTSMIGSKAVIGQLSGVNEFSLNGKTGPQVEQEEDSNGVRDATFTKSDEFIRLSFICSSIVGVPVSLDGSDSPFVFAFGETETLGQHSNTDRGALTLNLRAPEPTPAGKTVSVLGGRGSLNMEAVNENEVRFLFEVAGESGWLSVGISPTNAMIGSKVLVGQNSGVAEYSLNGKQLSTVVEQEASNGIRDEKFEIVDGVMRLSFYASSFVGEAIAIDGTDNSITFAFGTDEELATHLASDRGIIQAAFYAPESFSLLEDRGSMTIEVLNDAEVRIVYEMADVGSGWLAAGISPNGGMIGSRVVVGDATGISEYELNGKSGATVEQVSDTGGVRDQTFESVNGDLRLSFIASSIAGEPIDVDSIDSKIVFAYGSSENLAIHSADDRGQVTAGLAGVVIEDTGDDDDDDADAGVSVPLIAGVSAGAVLVAIAALVLYRRSSSGSPMLPVYKKEKSSGGVVVAPTEYGAAVEMKKKKSKKSMSADAKVMRFD